MRDFDHDVIISNTWTQFQLFDFDLRLTILFFLLLFRIAEFAVIHDLAYRGLCLRGDLY